MKKIGIVTLNGYFNYGNRLQNYALQTVLEKMGYDVETLIIQEEYVKPKSVKEKIFSKSFFELLNIPRNKYYQKKYSRSNQERYILFKNFSENYIKETDYFISERKLPNELNSFWGFVTGSDQVWNPNYRTDPSLYFLSFATDDQHKISYAASFGVSKIESNTDLYKNLLLNLDCISCREESGAEIVSLLSEKKSIVSVDPTLLISKKEWSSFSSDSKFKIKEKYLLTYFLGGIPKNIRKEFEKIAENRNLKIINLGDEKDKYFYKSGPKEFVNLVEECELFCTDSFHGAVFSIIFEKPFVVYKRQGPIEMYTRIDTLLKKFNLNDRKRENLVINDSLFEIDFEEARNQINIERNKSIDYLKFSLTETKK